MLKQFIKKSNSIHNNFYDYSLVKYKNNKNKVQIICPIHGMFEQTPQNHTQGQGCKKCSLNRNSKLFRKSIPQLLNEFNQIHLNKYDYSLVKYKNTNTKVQIICPTHGIFGQTPKNHLNGSGCPKCAIEYKSNICRKELQLFINQSISVHGDKYGYNNVKYKNNKLKVIVTCKKHGDFKIEPSHHLNGVGCSKCSGNYKRSTLEFICAAIKIHSNKYDYSLIDYKNSKSKVKIICKKHGEFEQSPEHHLNGSGCLKCKSSKGEKKIREYLKKFNIKYKEQKRFDGCKNKKYLPFDFYLPEYNICIEYDGLQHFKPIEYFGGEKALKVTKKHDNIKNEYCNNNNIRLIRIKYNENNIEQIISKIKN